MTRDFDYIVGGIRVRLGEERNDDFVDALAGRGLDQFPEMRVAGLEIMPMGQPQQIGRASCRERV